MYYVRFATNLCWAWTDKRTLFSLQIWKRTRHTCYTTRLDSMWNHNTFKTSKSIIQFSILLKHTRGVVLCKYLSLIVSRAVCHGHCGSSSEVLCLFLISSYGGELWVLSFCFYCDSARKKHLTSWHCGITTSHHWRTCTLPRCLALCKRILRPGCPNSCGKDQLT